MAQTSALASQGLYPQSGRPDPDVRNLATGILVQAIRDIIPKKSPDKDWRMWRDDSLEWFFDDRYSPGSFFWVCDVLGATPRKIRHWIKVFQKSDLPRQKRMASRMINFRLRR